MKCYLRKRVKSSEPKQTSLYYEQVFHQYYETFKFKGRSGKPSHYHKGHS